MLSTIVVFLLGRDMWHGSPVTTPTVLPQRLCSIVTGNGYCEKGSYRKVPRATSDDYLSGGGSAPYINISKTSIGNYGQGTKCIGPQSLTI